MTKEMYRVRVFERETDSETWMEERAIEGYVLESVGTMPPWYEGGPQVISVSMRYAPDEAFAKLKASVAGDGGER